MKRRRKGLNAVERELGARGGGRSISKPVEKEGSHVTCGRKEDLPVIPCQGAGIAQGGSHMEKLQPPQKTALHPHEENNTQTLK